MAKPAGDTRPGRRGNLSKEFPLQYVSLGGSGNIHRPWVRAHWRSSRHGMARQVVPKWNLSFPVVRNRRHAHAGAEIVFRRKLTPATFIARKSLLLRRTRIEQVKLRLVDSYPAAFRRVSTRKYRFRFREIRTDQFDGDQRGRSGES